MKEEDDSNLDAHFPIRTYGKGELAMCYIRGGVPAYCRQTIQRVDTHGSGTGTTFAGHGNEAQ